MDSLADALVEAVTFVAYRQYDEDLTIDAFEEEDIRALESVKARLAGATEEERQALDAAVHRAMATLPPDSELLPYYRAWMDNMFEEEDAMEAE
jgi:hypothetical protein